MVSSRRPAAPHSCKALARPPSPAPLAAVRGGQLVRNRRLRCAHAEPEALHRAVTPAASPSRGDVRRPPLPLSEPQLGSHCSPPLLHQAPRCSHHLPFAPPTAQRPPPGSDDWPAWVTCSPESQSTARGFHPAPPSGNAHPHPY